MRIVTMAVFTLGMVAPTFAGLLTERDRGSQWFQNCEEEIARPFCGTLKINLAVEALISQRQEQSTFDLRATKSPADQPPTTSYLAPHSLPEAFQPTEGAP